MLNGTENQNGESLVYGQFEERSARGASSRPAAIRQYGGTEENGRLVLSGKCRFFIWTGVIEFSRIR